MNPLQSHPNASVAGLAGASVTLLLFAAHEVGYDAPPEVSAALVTIVSAGVLAIGKRKKPRKRRKH